MGKYYLLEFKTEHMINHENIEEDSTRSCERRL